MRVKTVIILLYSLSFLLLMSGVVVVATIRSMSIPAIVLMGCGIVVGLIGEVVRAVHYTAEEWLHLSFSHGGVVAILAGLFFLVIKLTVYSGVMEWWQLCFVIALGVGLILHSRQV